MAAVAYSVDGGTTWVTPVGDAWPTTSGVHLIRHELKNAPLTRRIMVRVTGTDDDTYGVRQIVIKGEREPQEKSLT
jgi:hypothetical protein